MHYVCIMHSVLRNTEKVQQRFVQSFLMLAGALCVPSVTAKDVQVKKVCKKSSTKFANFAHLCTFLGQVCFGTRQPANGKCCLPACLVGYMPAAIDYFKLGPGRHAVTHSGWQLCYPSHRITICHCCSLAQPTGMA
jgi:hypothetical protein